MCMLYNWTIEYEGRDGVKQYGDVYFISLSGYLEQDVFCRTHTWKWLHASFCGISVNAKLFMYNQKYLLIRPDDW